MTPSTRKLPPSQVDADVIRGLQRLDIAGELARIARGRATSPEAVRRFHRLAWHVREWSVRS